MRILTGIQPSGQIHLGNYFGAIQNVLKMQEQNHQVFMFLADFHALTTVRDPEALRAGSISAALDFLACGVDPEKTVFWRQSAVPEVQELAWLLPSSRRWGSLSVAIPTRTSWRTARKQRTVSSLIRC